MRFETAQAAALEPFGRDGVLMEQIVAEASIYGRRPGVDYSNMRVSDSE
jgi:hypothetical protein